MTPAETLAARRKLGLTQRELVPMMGLLTARAISDWETGRRPIPAQAELLLRAYLDGWRPAVWT